MNEDQNQKQALNAKRPIHERFVSCGEYDKKTFDKINKVIKTKIAELKDDYEKLKAVDSLIGEDATKEKKHDLLNSVFVLQEVQSESMDILFTPVKSVSS